MCTSFSEYRILRFENNKQDCAKGGFTACTTSEPPVLRRPEILNTKHNARKIAIVIEITNFTQNKIYSAFYNDFVLMSEDLYTTSERYSTK